MRKVGLVIGAIGGVFGILLVAFIVDLGGIRSVSEEAISAPNENLRASLGSSLGRGLVRNAARSLTKVENLAVKTPDDLTRLSGATQPVGREAQTASPPKLVKDVDETLSNPKGKSSMSPEARKQLREQGCSLVMHLMAQDSSGSGSRPSDVDIGHFVQSSGREGLTGEEQSLIEENLRSIRNPLWKAKSENALSPDLLQQLGEVACKL